jgi:hypothetical protein
MIMIIIIMGHEYKRELSWGSLGERGGGRKGY